MVANLKKKFWGRELLKNDQSNGAKLNCSIAPIHLRMLFCNKLMPRLRAIISYLSFALALISVVFTSNLKTLYSVYRVGTL